MFWESASRILAFARSRKHRCNPLCHMLRLRAWNMRKLLIWLRKVLFWMVVVAVVVVVAVIVVAVIVVVGGM